MHVIYAWCTNHKCVLIVCYFGSLLSCSSYFVASPCSPGVQWGTLNIYISTRSGRARQFHHCAPACLAIYHQHLKWRNNVFRGHNSRFNCSTNLLVTGDKFVLCPSSMKSMTRRHPCVTSHTWWETLCQVAHVCWVDLLLLYRHWLWIVWIITIPRFRIRSTSIKRIDAMDGNWLFRG